MNVDFSKINGAELEKAVMLINAAKSYKMDLSGYGELAVNPNSGYTYLWLEDYPFTLFIGIHDEEVNVMYTNMEDGEETEEMISKFDTLADIYDWVDTIEEN